jgi:hypothetical protein
MTKLLASPSGQMLAALCGWLMFVSLLAMIFRSWWVLELYIFPGAVLIWLLRNEDRLKRTRPDLRPLTPGVKFHLLFTVPALIAIRLIIAISQAVKEPDAWRLMLAMSFGLAWVIVIEYAFAIVARKRAVRPESESTKP